jgi:hypothetical protein
VRAIACAAAVLACALATSGCASSLAAHQQSSTDAVRLHESSYGQLSWPLRNFIHSTIASSSDDSISEIDVYGPASRAALVKASSGDGVFESPREQQKLFYLIVLHGRFVCGLCSGPAGAKPPQGTIETFIWSHGAAAAGYGIRSSLPAAVSLLNRLAVIQPS